VSDTERTRYDLVLDRWFGGARCLAFPDGPDAPGVLVSGGLPGEHVEVEVSVTPHRRRHRVVRVHRASPARIEPLCPLANTCTGCGLLHASEEEELHYKRLTIAEVLQRFANTTVPAAEIASIGDARRGDHRFRASATFALSAAPPPQDPSDGRTVPLVLGLRSHNGEIVDTSACPANTALIRAVLSKLRALVARAFTSETGSLIGATVHISDGVEGCGVELPGAVLDAHPQLTTLALRAGAIGVARRDGDAVELVGGRWPRQRPVGEIALDTTIGGWTQPTPDRAALVHAWVAAHLPHAGAACLDLTCGTGALALRIAARAASLVAVDASWDALQSAKRAAAAAGLHQITFRGGKAQTIVARMKRDGARVDVAIINPMRRSLGDATMHTLSELGVREIAYLAPAPRAGAEDVCALIAAGFVVTRVAAANLHPGTPHVMMCVLLSRRADSA